MNSCDIMYEDVSMMSTEQSKEYLDAIIFLQQNDEVLWEDVTADKSDNALEEEYYTEIEQYNLQMYFVYHYVTDDFTFMIHDKNNKIYYMDSGVSNNQLKKIYDNMVVLIDDNQTKQLNKKDFEFIENNNYNIEELG